MRYDLDGDLTKAQRQGTTTVGLVCKDGVVFAADKRASLGNLIATKRAEKIFEVDKHIGTTVAGSLGDLQFLVNIMRIQARLYSLRQGKRISVNSLATLLSNILQSSKFLPYWVHIIVGGYEKEGSRIYTLDPAGGKTEDKMVSTGSGSTIAYGVLEDRYDENITVETGVNLALRSVKVAIERDVFTGDGIDLVTITEKGFKKYTDKEKEKLIKSLESS
ncbi:MAG: proteasome endopeptidase complex, archaeal, beta subunit [Methanobacteriota archaeon]|nr:MAG: proteasome endopeptidase complex, archaeal, beta subunit [Euryarchaeota archaeon]